MLEKLKSLFNRTPKRESKLFWSPNKPLHDLQTGDIWFETDHWGHENGDIYVYTNRKKWRKLKYE